MKGEKKSRVQHCTGCKGRTIGCGVLSFLPLCITPSHSLSSCTPGFSLHAGVCLYRHTHDHVYKGNYLQDASKEAKCLIPSMAATLPCRLAAPELAPDNDPYEIR